MYDVFGMFQFFFSQEIVYAIYCKIMCTVFFYTLQFTLHYIKSEKGEEQLKGRKRHYKVGETNSNAPKECKSLGIDGMSEFVKSGRETTVQQIWKLYSIQKRGKVVNFLTARMKAAVLPLYEGKGS